MVVSIIKWTWIIYTCISLIFGAYVCFAWCFRNPDARPAFQEGYKEGYLAGRRSKPEPTTREFIFAAVLLSLMTGFYWPKELYYWAYSKFAERRNKS